MTGADSGNHSLAVREHVRHDVAFDADLAIVPEHAQAVRFASSVAGRHGRLPVSLTDVSEGGLGVMSTVFVPRNAMADLVVRNPALPQAPPVFKARIRVQRITMTDRRPGYLLGASFVDTSPEFAKRLDAFLRLLDGEDDAPAPANDATGGPASRA